MDKKVPSRILNYVRAFGIEVDSISPEIEFSYENETLEKRNEQNTISWELFTKRQKRALFSTIGKHEDGSDASFTFQINNCVIDVGHDISNNALKLSANFDRGSQISSFYDLVICTDTQGIHIILEELRFPVGHIVISSSQSNSVSAYLELLKRKIDECPRIGDILDKNVLKAMVSDPVVVQFLNTQINKMFTSVDVNFETDTHNIGK